jgi:hypothetical protein
MPGVARQDRRHLLVTVGDGTSFRLLAGSVDMRHNGGIRPREIAQNKILLCCSKPLEDLAIDA